MSSRVNPASRARWAAFRFGRTGLTRLPRIALWASTTSGSEGVDPCPEASSREAASPSWDSFYGLLCVTWCTGTLHLVHWSRAPPALVTVHVLHRCMCAL